MKSISAKLMSINCYCGNCEEGGGVRSRNCYAFWKITDQERVPFCDTEVATPK